MDEDQRAPNVAKPSIVAVVARLVGLDLLVADRVLNDARRLCWMTVFAGRGEDEAVRQVGASGPAIDVAALCAGLTLVEVESLIYDARLLLWAQNFARLPDTIFGRQFEANAERADLLEKGGTIQ